MRSRVLFLALFCSACIGCHGQRPATEKPESAQGSSLHTASAHIFAMASGDSSFLFIKDAGSSPPRRLTNSKTGWETDGALSPNGEAVAYALAEGPEARSEVWVSTVAGDHAHRVSGADQDAVMPAFSPDSKTLLYVISRFTGNYSPIARARRHKFDVVKVQIDPLGPVPGATPTELTHQAFFDLRSLAASPNGENFLVCTSGYPIGSLIEEFDIANPLQIGKIFQPHVPSEPSSGASFGQAGYTPDGMGVVFTAATEGNGGMFDYNVYKMSDVTGGDIVELTHRTGTIDQMNVNREGIIFFSAGGQRYSLDPHTRSLQQD